MEDSREEARPWHTGPLLQFRAGEEEDFLAEQARAPLKRTCSVLCSAALIKAGAVCAAQLVLKRGAAQVRDVRTQSLPGVPPPSAAAAPCTVPNMHPQVLPPLLHPTQPGRACSCCPCPCPQAALPLVGCVLPLLALLLAAVAPHRHSLRAVLLFLSHLAVWHAARAAAQDYLAAGAAGEPASPAVLGLGPGCPASGVRPLRWLLTSAWDTSWVSIHAAGAQCVLHMRPHMRSHGCGAAVQSAAAPSLCPGRPLSPAPIRARCRPRARLPLQVPMLGVLPHVISIPLHAAALGQLSVALLGGAATAAGCSQMVAACPGAAAVFADSAGALDALGPWALPPLATLNPTRTKWSLQPVAACWAVTMLTQARACLRSSGLLQAVPPAWTARAGWPAHTPSCITQDKA